VSRASSLSQAAYLAGRTTDHLDRGRQGTGSPRPAHCAGTAEAQLGCGVADDLNRDFTRGEVAVENDAREAIVGAARDWNADLIAMGARGPGAVARFFVGRVSLAAVRDAP